MYQVGGEEKAVKKLQKLKNYLKDGLPRYTDILKEQGRKMPQAPQGIEYRDMGTMESQIFSVLEVKLCSGRKSFLKQGANYLSKVCVEYFENNGEIELEKIENEIPVDNSVQEWIEEIERNVQANKKRHMANEKITEVYNCPRGTVIGVSQELKQLLKILEPTALMYR